MDIRLSRVASENTGERDYEFNSFCRGAAAPALRCGHVQKRGEMATDLKVSVRRQIDRLKKELAVATGQVAALQDEIKRHELIYGMLDGRKTGNRSRQGPSTAGSFSLSEDRSHGARDGIAG